MILPGMNGLETVISACTATFPTFDIGDDSSYQNGIELLALAAGLALAVKFGFAGHEIHLRGDRMTFLNWVSSGRDGAASSLAYPAMMIVVALAEHWDLAFDTAFTHLSSEANEVCVRISRGLTVPREATGGSLPVTPSGPHPLTPWQHAVRPHSPGPAGLVFGRHGRHNTPVADVCVPRHAAMVVLDAPHLLRGVRAMYSR